MLRNLRQISELNSNEDVRRHYYSRSNRGLRYTAYALAAVMIGLYAVLIVWMDSLSYIATHLLRGCIGLLAISFVIICGILMYRVYTGFIADKYRRRTPKDQ